jgi:hypothetical protein
MLNLTAVILDPFNGFEELQNGLYNLLLSVSAVFHIWKSGAIRPIAAV